MILLLRKARDSAVTFLREKAFIKWLRINMVGAKEEWNLIFCIPRGGGKGSLLEEICIGFS